MDKTRKRAIVFSVLVALGMMLPASLPAQEQQGGRRGGLFGENAPEAFNGLMNRSGSTVGGGFTGQGFGATNGNITGQTFGTPLGSGLLILLVAGAGYATMRSKKTQKQNQNRKGK